jgi:hypothetical protein
MKRFSKSIFFRWVAAISLAVALVFGTSACSSDPDPNDQTEQDVDNEVEDELDEVEEELDEVEDEIEDELDG